VNTAHAASGWPALPLPSRPGLLYNIRLQRTTQVQELLRRARLIPPSCLRRQCFDARRGFWFSNGLLVWTLPVSMLQDGNYVFNQLRSRLRKIAKTDRPKHFTDLLAQHFHV